MVDGATPAADSRFLASTVAEEAGVRVVVCLVEELEKFVAVRDVAVVLGLTELVDDVMGLLAPVVLLDVPTTFFSAALLGLETTALVLLGTVDVGGFLSSSLALTLGRLRWADEAEVEVVGRRVAVVAEVGGLVGGLLSPPVARVPVATAAALLLAAVLGVVVEVLPGLRAAVGVAAAPGRFAPLAVAVLDSPSAFVVGARVDFVAGVELVDFAEASGDEGVDSLGSEDWAAAPATGTSSG